MVATLLFALQSAAIELPKTAASIEAEAAKKVFVSRFWPGLPLNRTYDVSLVLHGRVTDYDRFETQVDLGLEARHTSPQDTTLSFAARFSLHHFQLSELPGDSANSAAERLALMFRIDAQNDSLTRGMFQELIPKPMHRGGLAWPVNRLGLWMFGFSGELTNWTGEGTDSTKGFLGTTSWAVRRHFGNFYVGVGKAPRFEEKIELEWALLFGLSKKPGNPY